MAIQRVGGSKVYVIRGTTQPQSYGQQWAGLVAQNKYRLWESAQQDALRQLQQTDLDFREQQQVYNELKRDLDREINYYQKTADRLRAKEAAPIKGTSGRTGAGRILKTDSDDVILEKVAKERRITKDRAFNEYNFYLKENKRIDKEAAKLEASPNPMEKKKAQALRDQKYTSADMEEAKENYDNALGQYKTAQSNLRKTAEEKRELAKPYRPRTTTTGAKTTAGVEAKPAEYEPLIAEYDTKIAQLEAELSALERPTRTEQPSLIEKTREVYGQSFQQPTSSLPISGALQRFRRPSAPVTTQTPSEEPATVSTAVSEAPKVSPSRLAELEALGVDEAFIDQLVGIPEQPVQLEEPPQFMGEPVTTGDPELAREQARERLEREYQPSPLTRVIEGYSGDQFNEIDQASLREESPTFEDVMQDRQRQIEIDRTQSELAQQEGRAEAEAQRALIPNPIQEEPLTEGQRRSAITAPMVQNIPRRDESMRQMEMEALGIQPMERTEPFIVPDNIRYKSEVIGAAAKMTQDDVNKLINPDDPAEWASVVLELYTIKKEMDQETKDKILKNAWDQIDKTYEDSPALRQNAHELLLALDRLTEEKNK